jgi:hypothetical protein
MPIPFSLFVKRCEIEKKKGFFVRGQRTRTEEHVEEGRNEENDVGTHSPEFGAQQRSAMANAAVE